MESVEKCEENGVENGKCEEICDTTDQQYEAKQENLLTNYDEMDNKVFDFEAHFNGNGLCSGDEYDDDDDGSLEHR